MLKKIGDAFGILSTLSALALLFLLAVYETRILSTIGFNIIALTFDASLLLSHILLIIYFIKKRKKKGWIAFSVSTVIFTGGFIILLVIQKDPRFLLCLYDVLMVLFYGTYFISTARSAKK